MKNFFTLALCTTVLTTSPLFAMEKEDYQAAGLKKVNLAVMFERSSYSPSHMSGGIVCELTTGKCLTHYICSCGVRKKTLGFFDLVDGDMEKKEVFLPSEIGTIKFTYKVSLLRNMQSTDESGERYFFQGDFYDGDIENPIYDIQNLSISDGSTLELYIKASRTRLERKSLETPIYELDGRLTINK